ncbi:response regulator [Subtercola sp. PAMC28395]|uniref:response regulator n=1 Tax=Subtercola sp. PAMC28395 TaxID=2846775 RepID=UPI001C0B6889|nr:response regulator [Subtercola sp. PAMC28395]QWT24529.1 response regulator [Subtercola sp. PAMC28395]
MCEVLIVDDDFMVARAHQRIVQQLPGFQVVGVAHSGEQSLELIDMLAPQLVLLDMYLPDMTGLEVIRRARSEGVDVDFLVLSAAREAEMVTAALQGGIVSYLLKPFKISELTSRLAAYAERRELLSQPGTLSQADLDQALGSAGGAASGRVADLPKGLSKETGALIERVLREATPDIAASECGDSLGMSRVVARKYLEYFVGNGQASVSLRYGQTGRPQRRYAWIAG